MPNLLAAAAPTARRVALLDGLWPRRTESSVTKNGDKNAPTTAPPKTSKCLGKWSRKNQPQHGKFCFFWIGILKGQTRPISSRLNCSLPGHPTFCNKKFRLSVAKCSARTSMHLSSSASNPTPLCGLQVLSNHEACHGHKCFFFFFRYTLCHKDYQKTSSTTCYTYLIHIDPTPYQPDHLEELLFQAGLTLQSFLGKSLEILQRSTGDHSTEECGPKRLERIPVQSRSFQITR